MNSQTISVIGLGKLGLCLSVCFAHRGFKTYGVDINKKTVTSLQKGKLSITEPNLEELFSKSKKNFIPTTSHELAIKKTDTTFVLVATPSDRSGNFSNVYLEKALKSLARAFAKNKKKYHLFVVSSTVIPMSLNQKLIPLIEKYSKKKLNVDFGICYIPEFVALGRVVNDFLGPDLVVIGESNKKAGEIATSVIKKLCSNNPPIFRMSLISSEIAKISLNNFITMKISFANMIGDICERVPGSQVDLITQAIGVDRRISPFYLKAGAAYGGHCFPRDTKAFIAFSKKLKYSPKLIQSVENLNNYQHLKLFKLVEKELNRLKIKKASVLGITFNPKTTVVEESAGLNLIKRLLKKRIKIMIYDPAAIEETKKHLGNQVKYAGSVEECIRFSSLIVITMNSNQFDNLKRFKPKKKVTIIDCWRTYPQLKSNNNIRYLALGVAS
ncbi:hypothetical protein A2164_00950 [Candidatus Curtissbacteria bacterium RBG_13_35_7]|uniref:UDP-glucose 6-dehydrogenase n=1 Tax=Candidatus Curtissbacteria bacterium RBG_13_35_7 TaxID=1797705 RepID=A0A1F5G4U9_9BACT|nr:MAG: hypothetical protein A2164_00950 [Candidatus Curtissbacteria bacterium RBG_13_35_7]